MCRSQKWGRSVKHSPHKDARGAGWYFTYFIQLEEDALCTWTATVGAARTRRLARLHFTLPSLETTMSSATLQIDKHCKMVLVSTFGSPSTQKWLETAAGCDTCNKDSAAALREGTRTENSLQIL